jgi:hypothetical protein
LAKLGFQLSAFGNVFREDFEQFFRLLGTTDGATIQAHGNGVSVLASPFHLYAIEAASLPILLEQPILLRWVLKEMLSRFERQEFV